MHTACHTSRRVKILTLASCALVFLFVLFFHLSKHNPILSPANVFIEDPFDAVGSFGIQLASLAALLSFIRILRPGPSGSAPDSLGLILRGDLVAMLSILVTLFADGVALLRYLPAWTKLPGGLPLVGLMLGLFIFTVIVFGFAIRIGRSLQVKPDLSSSVLPIFFCLAAIIILAIYPDSIRQTVGGSLLTALVGAAILFATCWALAIWIFPSDSQTPEDMLDDLACLYQWLRTRLSKIGFLFHGVEALARRTFIRMLARWLNPRQHAWDLILLVALAVGMSLVAAASILEEIPSLQSFLFILGILVGLEAAGVVLGYVLFNNYLQIFKTS